MGKNKKTDIMKKIINLVLVTLILSSCSENVNKTTNKYLSKVLKNLNKIESVSYLSKGESWQPGDTAAAFIFQRYVEAYNNPSDTTIGSSWVVLNEKDKTHLEFAYDGKMRTLIYDDEKRMVIDSFKVRKLPFRPVSPPFYNYTKSILKYALATKDSIVIERKNLDDAVYLKLTIYEDRQVEFFGKAHFIPKSPYNLGDPTSRYELWIDKSTNLPYRIRREMSHDISVTSVSNPEFNKIKIENFTASDYFPKDYEISQYGESNKRLNPNKLLGKKAPNWLLTDSDGKEFSLSDLKSKVVLIQFTSVSCGPCKASIPFLKKLPSKYKEENFDFVAIECTSRNSNVLKNYMIRNNFDYRFLLSTKEVIKDYSIKSFPVFFILDENYVIKNVITGYGIETTDKQIFEAINELI